MNKELLKTLSGKELFEYYTSLDNEYIGTLFQAFQEIGEELYPMLEKCEKEGKSIVINEDIEEAFDSPITVSIA